MLLVTPKKLQVYKPNTFQLIEQWNILSENYFVHLIVKMIHSS